MKRKNLIIICFSALLFLAAAVGAVLEQKWSNLHSISVDVISEGGVERVNLWMGPGEMYYLFLPGYADLSQVQIHRNLLGPVSVDYKPVADGMDCSDLPLNEPVTLIHDPYFGYRWNEMTVMQSGKVPTLYIDVRSGNMDYIHEVKGNKESGTMRLYTEDGALDATAVVESLQGHGNSTWQPWLEKKPYSLRLTKDTDLLGMGAGSSWVLLAEAFDLSLIKNKMTYDLAADAGMPYAPKSQWVDLYLNGVYSGLYLLAERNEIHPNRVDVPAESSFLVAWESEHRMIAQGYPYVKTDRGNTIRVHQSALPLEEVRAIWQSAENAIFAEDGIDPLTGKHWQDLVDLDSWAKLFLIDEISSDYDGGKISKFFYYKEIDGEGKIYGGPVWDKDDTFATGHWSTTPPNCIVASRSNVVNGKEQRMFRGIYQKDAFASRVAQLYETTFRPLLVELYDYGIENYAAQIHGAADLSEFRYQLGYTPEEHETVKEFLGARIGFLDAYWIRKEEFCYVEVFSPSEGCAGLYAVRPGDPIPCLPEYAPEAGNWAWYIRETEEPYDVKLPVESDLNLLLKKVQ